LGETAARYDSGVPKYAIAMPSFMNPGLIGALAGVLLAGAVPESDARDPFETERLTTPARNAALPGTVADPCLDAVPSSLTLVDAIHTALCRNPQTRQTWANARIAAAQLGVARSAYLPEMNADVSLQRVQTRNIAADGESLFSVGATLNYLLFDFGGRDAALESAREALVAANWDHNATLQQVVYDTVEAYYRLFAANENVTATRVAEDSARQSLDAAQARWGAGRGTRAEVLQAQTATSQARLNRTRAEGDAASARGVLANVLGLETNSTLALTPPPPLTELDFAREAIDRLLETAKIRRPELRAAEAQIRAAEANAKAVDAQRWPVVSAFADVSSLQRAPGGDPRSGAVGVTVNIPLFTGYRNTYQRRAAREQVAATEASRDRLAQEIALDVWTAYQTMQTEGQAYQASLDLVASAGEAYRAALARYRAGVGTLIDVLSAQSAAADAEFQKIRSQFSWYISKAALARALGTLDAGLFAQTAGPPDP
jgi:outer membrane protein TolC